MPKACAHWRWSNLRANTAVSASTVLPITHSGKYSWVVACWVNVVGATGSPENITVVTPADFSLAMALSACSCSRAGSRV